MVTNSLPVIDLLKEYPKKEIKLQDIAEVNYIPFETSDSALLKGSSFTYMIWQGDTIITRSENTVCFFNSSGKFLHSFDRHGGSSEEYKTLVAMTADFVEKEVFIVDYPLRESILVYSFDGKFKRKLNLPKNTWIFGYLYNHDTNFLFCENQFMEDKNTESISKNPYFIFSKKTGETIPLSFTIDERITNGCTTNDMSFSINIEPIMKNDSEIIISDFSLDTIYSLHNNILTPIAVRENRISNEGNPMLATVAVKTDRYIIWDIVEKKIDTQQIRSFIEGQHIFFDRQTGEINEVEFINTDFTSPLDIKRIHHELGRHTSDIPANYALQPISTDLLVELYNEGKLRGKLKEIASKLNEEDNPVLMVVKFKE